MDWFLFDNGLRHERVNHRLTGESGLVFTLYTDVTRKTDNNL